MNFYISRNHRGRFSHNEFWIALWDYGEINDKFDKTVLTVTSHGEFDPYVFHISYFYLEKLIKQESNLGIDFLSESINGFFYYDIIRNIIDILTVEVEEFHMKGKTINYLKGLLENEN